MRALQDSETAAQIAGVNVARVKLAAFVLSAVYASVAGSCFSFSAGLITPDKAGFLYSVELVTMVVIGGMGSILGSVVGAAVLVALPQLLASFQNYEQIMLGLVMMAMMIFLRSGIVPSLTSWVSQWRR
jgi:branched-chain amino acid transport system permease protein